MKKTIIFLLSFLTAQLLIAQEFDIEFQQCYGGSDTDYPTSIIALDNGFIVLGTSYSYDGDVSFQYGGGDIWLVRADANGNILWEKTYGGSENDNGFSILPTPDGGFLLFGETFSADGDVGHSNGFLDYWVIKTDSMGNLEWEQTYGGSKNDYAYQAIIAHDGGYILTGNTFSSDGDVSFHHGDRDVWVVKISAEGMLEWERCYGGTAIDSGSCISRTSDGGYIIGGISLSRDGDVPCTIGISGLHFILMCWKV